MFFGCGAAVVGGMGSGPAAINLLGIASAFGFAIVAMAYGIGPVSGCHVNPAVSFGVFVAGRWARPKWSATGSPRCWARLSARGCLSHSVGQGAGLERRAWPERLGPRLYRRIQRGFGLRLRGGRDLPVPGLHSRRHPPVRADRLRRTRHRADAGRHPPRRHQHHRHLGQSGPLDRPGAGRHRLEPAAVASSGCSSSRR